MVALPTPTPIRPATDIIWLIAGTIGTDHRYQRPLSTKHVDKIVRGFDPDLFGVLTVAQRDDGRYFVIDGQHRLAALDQMGWLDQKVPCVLFSGLALDEEADKFSGLQRGRKSLTSQDTFRSDLVSGWPDVISIRGIVEGVGFSINTQDSDRSHGRISAVGSLRVVYRTYQGDRLTPALTIIRDAWGLETGPTAFTITGLGAFCARYSDLYSHARAVRALALVSESQFRAAGSDQRRFHGTSVDVGSGRAMLTLYNRGLRSNQLPEWSETSAYRGRPRPVES